MPKAWPSGRPRPTPLHTATVAGCSPPSSGTGTIHTASRPASRAADATADGRSSRSVTSTDVRRPRTSAQGSSPSSSPIPARRGSRSVLTWRRRPSGSTQVIATRASLASHVNTSSTGRSAADRSAPRRRLARTSSAACWWSTGRPWTARNSSLPSVTSEPRTSIGTHRPSAWRTRKLLAPAGAPQVAQPTMCLRARSRSSGWRNPARPRPSMSAGRCPVTASTAPATSTMRNSASTTTTSSAASSTSER